MIKPDQAIDQFLSRAVSAVSVHPSNPTVHARKSGTHRNAQQAAEKFLKVLMIHRGVRPPRTHGLTELIAELHALGCDFPPFADECRRLEPYSVAIRYPEHAPLPDEIEGRAVIAAAWRIVEAARSRLSAG